VLTQNIWKILHIMTIHIYSYNNNMIVLTQNTWNILHIMRELFIQNNVLYIIYKNYSIIFRYENYY